VACCSIIALLGRKEHKERKVTPDELTRELQDLAQKLGKKRLTQDDIRSHSKLGYWIYKLFGGYASALEAAGLESSKLAKSMDTTDDELLDYLADLWRRLGREPRVADIDRDDEFSPRIFETRFGTVKDAIFALRERERERQFEAGRDYKGIAAEFLVVSELLYKGFNANLLPVDRGMDIVALKNEKTFIIQVKNISFDEGTESAKTTITASAYRRHQASQVHYILVLDRKQDRRFLILPFQILEQLFDKGVIPRKDPAAKKHEFYVLWHEGRIYINEVSEKADVTYFLNAWDKIL